MVKEYVFINAFRALAAYWVLAAHCMIWGGWYGVPLPSAKIAVDLFMMISGYLMMATALAKAGSEPMTERHSWYRFWLRRWFRIAPAYYPYLFHGFFIAAAGLLVASSPWLQALTPSLRVMVVLVFVSIGSYTVGYGVFRLVEIPCVRWGRRVIERVSPGAGKKVVAPLASRQRADS